MCVCVFAQTSLWLAPQPLATPQRGLSSQLGNMVEMVIAFSGATASGDRLPDQTAERAVARPAEDVKGKPGSEGYRHLPQGERLWHFSNEPEHVSMKHDVDIYSAPCVVDCGEEMNSRVVYKKGKLCAILLP